MQIVIVGAGIAGLSCYLFLQKQLANGGARQHSVRIYESYKLDQIKYDPFRDESDFNSETTPATKAIGGALGIGKNGLAVFGRIDETGEVLRQLKQRGNCISTWKIGTARGWRLVDANAESSIIRGDEKSVQPTVMIARQTAWEILRDKVLAVDPGAVTQAKVTEISPTDDGRTTVRFEDGSQCVADLVIGADGLKSIVRWTMFENTDDTVPQTWYQRLLMQKPITRDYITPHYEGLTGMGGFIPSKVLEQAGYENGAMSITFGPNGFFGHGYVGPVDTESENQGASSPAQHDHLAGWWSTFSSEAPYPFQEKKSGEDGTRSTKVVIDKEAALENLRRRHSTWRDPVIQAVLDYVSKNHAIEHMYPTYTTPELPTWHKSNMVLIGDAAHALQPSSGQGACQALEDSEALALLLSHYLNFTEVSQDKATSQALDKFVELRKPRLAKIYEQSQKFGRMKADMNMVQEFIMYFFIWLSTKLGGLKKYNEELFDYDLPAEVKRAVRV